MKVLIIGASGLLAGPVIRKLDEAGHTLRLFSRNVKPGMFIEEYEIVNGDLFHSGDLAKAMEGCNAIHISVSVDDEDKAVEQILEVAKAKSIQMVSMVSGATVSEENRWFPFTDKKFRAEQMIIKSGIPYLIFRSTWFFESLERMVRNGKAMVPARQVHPYHWVSSEDLGAMVTRAFSHEKYYNNIYYVYGPEQYTMIEIMKKYCAAIYPEIDKISETPLGLLKIIAFISRNKSLGFATKLFSYFARVPEPELKEEERFALGKPQTDFDTWIALKKQEIE